MSYWGHGHQIAVELSDTEWLHESSIKQQKGVSIRTEVAILLFNALVFVKKKYSIYICIVEGKQKN